jgi:hypothetical protein
MSLSRIFILAKQPWSRQESKTGTIGIKPFSDWCAYMAGTRNTPFFQLVYTGFCCTGTAGGPAAAAMILKLAPRIATVHFSSFLLWQLQRGLHRLGTVAGRQRPGFPSQPERKGRCTPSERVITKKLAKRKAGANLNLFHQVVVEHPCS